MAKQAGRKTKLTPELVVRICGRIKRGDYVRTACLSVGIAEATYYKWMELGEADRTHNPPKRSKYSEFVESVQHAEAIAQQMLVNRVVKLGGWKGSLEILSRRFPKEWGNRQTLSSGKDGNPLPEAARGDGPPVVFNVIMNQDKGDNPFTFADGEGPDDQPPEPTSPAPKGTPPPPTPPARADQETIQDRVRNLTNPPQKQ